MTGIQGCQGRSDHYGKLVAIDCLTIDGLTGVKGMLFCVRPDMGYNFGVRITTCN